MHVRLAVKAGRQSLLNIVLVITRGIYFSVDINVLIGRYNVVGKKQMLSLCLLSSAYSLANSDSYSIKIMM